MQQEKERFIIVDHMRGIAVVLMIYFHLFYDLKLFGYNNIDFINSPFWFGLPRVIVFLFLLSVGMSLRIVHLKAIKWRSFLKRFAKIALFAGIISLVTYLTYPSRWVYFGTLHCIALCSLAALPFLKFPRFSLAIGLSMLIAHFCGYKIPWFTLDHKAMDYIPFFPWISIVLLGIFLHSVNFHRLPYKLKSSILDFLGKKAFIIYILHQPILMACVYLYSLISPPSS